MLSFYKLEELLTQHNFRVNKIYAVDNMCIVLEIICLSNAFEFLLYIPSKYNINVPSGSTDGVYEVSYLDLNDEGKIIEESEDVDAPAVETVEKLYDEVDIEFHDKDKKKMVEHMEQKYNKPITLSSISNEDKNSIQNIFKQLSRLRHCTKNIKYKLAISFKNYLLFVKRDDSSIECVAINGGEGTGVKSFNLFVIIDLENFYQYVDE